MARYRDTAMQATVKAVRELMADGRERTTEDVIRQLGIDATGYTIGRAMRKIGAQKQLVCEIMVYRVRP